MTPDEKSALPNSRLASSTQQVDESPTSPSKSTINTGQSPSFWYRIRAIITYTPKRCRYDPAKPPSFSLFLNLLFGFAGTFTVANLYYNHPILNILARDFQVTNERASLVPTLAQAGYAGGEGFRTPLGALHSDRLDRFVYNRVVSCLLCFDFRYLCHHRDAATQYVILVIAQNLKSIELHAVLPLVGELAPAHRRATALSIVVSGLLLGILVARVLSGIVTNFTSWRNIYWLSCGLQYSIFGMLWLYMPDYPSTNPEGINYFRVLWSIVTLVFQEPVLVQACLTGGFTSMTFTSFWTTLTFLLSASPYNYSPLTIGLFALIGILGMCFGPPYSRFVIDKFVPLFSVIVGELICLVGVVVGTYSGQHSVGGPVIQAFLLDVGLQTAQIANRSAIYTIAPKARNRINTAFMVSIFAGQLTGTAVGNAFQEKESSTVDIEMEVGRDRLATEENREAVSTPRLKVSKTAPYD
ncbi:hypothetical protein G7Y79_00030g065300 [Physcia stellaris]|nr:hypothetical protein G7Y79_00030g065300 [Physcia stellaris]